ncbi:hypothetical protein CAOG_003307 [Capsaspora owczarzaki ATCC 30864]|uniref:Uncharacterized protein n=2 Tax=Capsaspora owczarzaki (strain ATCC 30864) TaxID=595528 RepID=A0A0D2UB82_CAPO3|nr:hypothetical protein CAOG_003307 [Capsaspora owczarzaki ATCC 30864]
MADHEQADDTTASTASTSSATSVPAEPMSTQEMMRMMAQVFREQMVSMAQEVVKDAMRKETLRAEGTMAAAGASSSTSAPGELVTEQSVMLLFAQFQEAVFKRMDEHGKRGAHDETPELAETSHAVSTTAVATTSSPDVTITSTTPASAAICTNLRRHGSKVERFSGSREDAKDIRRKTISDHNRDSLASTDSSAMLSYESMTEKQRELYDKAKNASETLQ